MTKDMSFNERESECLLKIAKYYDITKELLILGEQIDPENRTLTQPLNELRNCLDHIIRVVLFKFDLRPSAQGASDYAHLNLEKAYGHVYRATYDTLDWVALTIKELFVDELAPFSLETIKNVMPEYYIRIRPRFEEIEFNEIKELRLEKDVAVQNEENLVKYGQIASELMNLYKEITKMKPSLVDYESKLKKSKVVGLVTKVGLVVAGGLITLLGKWLLGV